MLIRGFSTTRMGVVMNRTRSNVMQFTGQGPRRCGS